MNYKKILGILLGLAVVLGFSTAVSAATSLITPANMQGWGFLQETATGTGAMVSGPGTTPLGLGSANLVVDSTGGVILAKGAYSGLKLSDITTLGYSTYRTSGGPALAIALQFNFDGDVTDGNNLWQGRLVYEPYHTQTVSTGEWQTWDALNDSAGSATGNWWFSNAGHAAFSTCTMAAPCTWAEVKAAFPNGGVHNTLGAVVLKAGGGWTGGFDGNVDKLVVNNDVYDFELSYPRTAAITSPTAGEDVSGLVNFTAYLNDDDVDAIQWAVRAGSCTSGTVFGNVDGKTDVATLDQTNLANQTFSFSGDMSAMTPGVYCFVYNPVEDGGEVGIRETVLFDLVAPTVVVPGCMDETADNYDPDATEDDGSCTYSPVDKDACKNGGWEDFGFRNQGLCIQYVNTGKDSRL